MKALEKTSSGREKASSGRSPEASASEKANERMTPMMEGFSPAGLKVLVVDDDPVCLMILEAMLRQCNYHVTTCQRAARALALLRENRSAYDLVMSDVYMPDMDGFKLLEAIGLELDLPVIMMSANGETEVVLKGITHGACDYLLKPVRIEELRNIWQHVIRRRGGRGETVRDDQSAVEWDESGRGLESPGGEGLDNSSSKKRKEMQEGPAEDAQPVEDVSSLKKARVVWSVELHQQFVNAVNQLGFEKAVPKRILEIMNVQGLSREHVASHLQKYRQYLKRLSGVNTQPYPVATFQAAPGGNFAGSMQVQPGGRGVAAAPGPKLLNVPGPRPDSGGPNIVGMGREPGAQIDATTLSLLAQLQAHQQGQQAGILPPSMLGGLNAQMNVGVSSGFPNRPPNPPFAGLDIMNSIELDMLMEAAQQDSVSRQQGGAMGGDEILVLGRSHTDLAPPPLPIGAESFKREDELDLRPGFGPPSPSPSPYPTLSKRGLSDSSYSSGFGD
ncbi:unnamed protein product [Calypogeia fissa]